jgi:hypothetical protein
MLRVMFRLFTKLQIYETEMLLFLAAVTANIFNV